MTWNSAAKHPKPERYLIWLKPKSTGYESLTETSRLAKNGVAALAMAIALAFSAANSSTATEHGGDQQSANQAVDCGVETSDGEEAVGVQRADEFSEKLERCGDVLEPAPVSDPEMVLPPPAGGETPVIPPSELPAN